MIRDDFTTMKATRDSSLIEETGLKLAAIAGIHLDTYAKMMDAVLPLGGPVDGVRVVRNDAESVIVGVLADREK